MFANWLEQHSRDDDCVEPDQEDCVACALKALTLAYRRGDSSTLKEALSLTNALLKKRVYSRLYLW